MIGFILAAGYGTRLRPLADHIPKALVPVCGMPLLQRSLLYFSRQGISRLAANVHHLPEQVYAFRDSSAIPFEIFHERDVIRGTGGALYFARDFLASDDLFCIANVDILSNVVLQKAVEKFRAHNAVGMLIAAPPRGTGTIFYDPETMAYCGVPADISANETVKGADFIGIAVYTRDMLEYITADDFSIIPVWRRVLEQGRSILVTVENDIFWRDTGTPRALAGIHFDVLERTLALSIPDTIHIDYGKSIAYPQILSPESVASLQEYVWTDSERIAPGAAITHSILLPGTGVYSGESLSHVILTPWGGIPFAE